MNVQTILAVITLAGTGGVIGGWINQFLRNRREDRLRWHGERREAYERFLTALQRWRNAEIQMAEYIGTLREITGWRSDPIFEVEVFLRNAERYEVPSTKLLVPKVRELTGEAREARDQVDASLAAIEILSTEPVIENGLLLRKHVIELIDTADQFPPRECGGWSDPLLRASDKVTEGRKSFMTTVRAELRVQ